MRQTPVAWVSLDENDDEPVRFWTYLLTALSGASDQISAAALDALRTSGAGPMQMALPVLINELAALPTRHVLVLDDYHVISDHGVQESLEFLISYLPPTARLVIASRWDPPLPLARMRARGELLELRAEDLRFSLDETRRDGVGGVGHRTGHPSGDGTLAADRGLGGRPAAGGSEPAG